LRYQNPDPNTISGKVKSIIQDTAQNLSAIDYLDLNIDGTPPVGLTSVSDLLSVDADTFYTSNEITAYWNQATDNHSDISHYELSVGTSAGDSNAVAWSSVGNVLNASLTGLSLTPNTDYFVNVRAVNNAGLKSSIVSSDGQYLLSGLGIEEMTSFGKLMIYPNPFQGQFTVEFDKGVGKAFITMYDSNGKMIKQWEKSEGSSQIECFTPNLAKGMYTLRITVNGQTFERKLIH
jgi:hypothetical protein